MTIHVVQPGETLYGIAGRYGVDPELLRVSNGVPEDGALAVGQALAVQFVRTLHVVQPGQSLSSIAAEYGIPLRQLYRDNYGLLGQPEVRAGQRLVIAYDQVKLGETFTNGYAYPYIQRLELAAVLPYMSCLTPFTYGIDSQGGLLPLEDGVLLEEARRLGTGPLMHLSSLTEEGTFSSQRAAELLADPAARAALTEQVAATMEARGYQGLDVDFEFIPAAQKEDYAQFIRELRQRLAPRGWPVLVALAPKTYAGQPGLLYEAHDYAALGAAADYVLLMTYEWGYTYGPPMAVAPLPNVRRVLDYAVTEIPPEKICLGIPNYGYDWPLPYRQGETQAQSLSNQEAVAAAVAYGAAIQYDETAQSPWFRYTAADGAIHEVWFEDARSISEKLRLIRLYGLHGAGYWNLDRPFPQGWTVLNALWDVANFPPAG